MPAFTDDFVLEQSTTIGVGAYALGGAVAGFRTFQAVFGTGFEFEYVGRIPDYSKWEHVRGSITAGQLSRTLIKSSTGSLINWQVGDPTRILHTITSADRLALLRGKHYASTEPILKQKGMDWLDSTSAPTGTVQKLWDGTQWITVGRLNETTHKYLHEISFPDYAAGTPVQDTDLLLIGDVSASSAPRKITIADIFPAWTSFTPAAAPSSGAWTTSSSSGKYLKLGKLVFTRVFIDVQNNGTGAGFIAGMLPFNPVVEQSGSGYTNTPAASFTVQNRLLANGQFIVSKGHDNGYPVVSGTNIFLNACYEAA